MSEEQKSKRTKIRVAALVGVLAVGIPVKLLYFTETFHYAGTLEATKVDLSAQLPSTIKEVAVREGDRVQLGQKIVALTCDDFRIANELATENYKRNLVLFRSGTASQETVDLMKNHKDDADVKLKWCDVSSPIQGTVLSRYHEPGEWVNPGVKLLTLANVRDIWAYVYVPQPEVSKLKPGMKLTGSLPEFGGRTFQGTILKINEEAEFTPKNVQTRSERQRLIFGVKVSFLGSNEDETLKPGMTIEVQLP